MSKLNQETLLDNVLFQMELACNRLLGDLIQEDVIFALGSVLAGVENFSSEQISEIIERVLSFEKEIPVVLKTKESREYLKQLLREIERKHQKKIERKDSAKDSVFKGMDFNNVGNWC
ncbi:MAG: hypothetical protein V1851_02085 [Patescibacteria group bacterium]